MQELPQILIFAVHGKLHQQETFSIKYLTILVQQLVLPDFPARCLGITNAGILPV